MIRELLDILRCPDCRGELVHDPKESTLKCKACGHVYRVEDDIPVMILDEKKNS